MIDSVDASLLNLLQRGDQLSTADLAQRVGLSPAGVHRRLKKLHETGIIRQRVALVDRHKVGIDLLCVLSASFKDNMNPRNRDVRERATAELPEVLECFMLTGETDVLIKIAVRDHTALKDFLHRFAKKQDVIARVQTAIVLEEIKVTTQLDIEPDSGVQHV